MNTVRASADDSASRTLDPLERRGSPAVHVKVPTAEAAAGPATSLPGVPPWPRRGEQLEDRGVIAVGGYAAVHRAFDGVLLRPVAMKVLSEHHAQKSTSLVRFMEEAQITGQLDHPNIVPVHEVGVGPDGHAFFTMKLVAGRTLAEIVASEDMDKDGREALHRVLTIFLRVCDAMAFAHSRGVIHRDLKPENVMVGEFGEVYVMDWGIAQLQDGERPSQSLAPAPAVRTRRRPLREAPGTVIGTPAFMAPEQANGWTDRIDARTDVFGLGGLLYLVLTGQPPFRAPDLKGRLKLAQKGKVTHPQELVPGRHLPAELCRIALKALRADPAERYQDVVSLRWDVEQFVRRGWWFAEKTFRKGEVIFQQGDEGDAAYIITSGRCEAFRQHGRTRQVLREMGPGSVFGETAILAGKPRSASVRAVEPTVAMVVTRKSLEHELVADSWMGHFVRALAERFLDLDSRMRDLEAHGRPAPAETRRARAPARARKGRRA